MTSSISSSVGFQSQLRISIIFTRPSTGSFANPSGGGSPRMVWYSPFTSFTGMAESAIAGSVK